MLLQVVHDTSYDYAPPVEVAQHMAYLRPRDLPCQQVVSHLLVVSPNPAQQSSSLDVFGNTRTFLSLQTPHAALRVVARSEVRTQTTPMLPGGIGWEPVRELFRYQARGAYTPACEFVFASHHVPRNADFANYARQSFAPGRGLLAAAQDLMHRIHDDFEYQPQSTQVNTPAQVALQQRKGVCQDFAHIMIACLRSLGLAARYVSGYLVTTPAAGTARLLGSDASHAWASVWLPDLEPAGGWCDFDPTNDRSGFGSPGEDYVVLAIGRDYSDVSPIRGVIHGGTNHVLQVGVTVTAVGDSSSLPHDNATADAPMLATQQQSQSW